MPRLALLFLVFILWPAAPAHADRRVFLNGQPIDGARNESIERAEVRIDAEGNINIQARGYRIERGKAEPGAPPEAYWLVALRSRSGATGYTIDVRINEEATHSVHDLGDVVAVEVTKDLRPGVNVVSLTARRTSGEATSPADFFKLILGAGRRVGNEIVIHETFMEYRRLGSDTGDFQDEQSFELP